MVNKNQERRRLKSQIKLLPHEYRQQAETKINQKLIEFFQKQKPQAIASYLSKESEVSTEFIHQWLLKHHWTVYVPKINDTKLAFYPIPKKKSDLVWKEHFKLWEPPQKGDAVTNFSIMIVPIVGYNNQGYRLGHGHGYYDRWLHKYKPQLIIGLAYAEQATDSHLTFNNFDVPLDWIITNKKEKND